MKFKLLSGSHCEMSWVEATEDEVASEVHVIKGKNGKWMKHVKRQHEAGAIFESNKDLVSMFGDRFELVSDDTPCCDGPTLAQKLDTLTIGELRALAVENDLPLPKTATDRDGMVKVLAKALS